MGVPELRHRVVLQPFLFGFTITGSTKVLAFHVVVVLTTYELAY